MASWLSPRWSARTFLARSRILAFVSRSSTRAWWSSLSSANELAGASANASTQARTTAIVRAERPRPNPVPLITATVRLHPAPLYRATASPGGRVARPLGRRSTGDRRRRRRALRRAMGFTQRISPREVRVGRTDLEAMSIASARARRRSRGCRELIGADQRAEDLACRSVGPGIQVADAPSQSRTRPRRRPPRGRSNALGCVPIRRKASRLCHGRPTREDRSAAASQPAAPRGTGSRG